LSLIKSTLENCKNNGRKAVIPYIVAGDPWYEITVPAMHSLVDAGADIIELGVPFSDPMAEGPTIQIGHERSLANQTSLKDVLNMVSEFRKLNKTTPIVLMGYSNPIEVMGYQSFAEEAAKVGVNGVLTVDMPPEEAQEINLIFREKNIDSIFLISPTTSDLRAKKICSIASGYIYYVSLKGVTGAANIDTLNVQEKVNVIKKNTTIPVCVGFGIKDAKSASEISKYSDGVVVGSVLVDSMGDCVGMNSRDTKKIKNIFEDDRELYKNKINKRLTEIIESIDKGINPCDTLIAK
jgi:tryptophan synthase alpha chain